MLPCPSRTKSHPIYTPFRIFNLRSEPRDYMKYIMKSINMSCLTPEGAMSGDCEFLSANMYLCSLRVLFRYCDTILPSDYPTVG